MKRTKRMREIENHYKINLTQWLLKKYREGYPYWLMAQEIGVSESTICKWMQTMGYSLRQAAALAYEKGLVREASFDDLEEVRVS